MSGPALTRPPTPAVPPPASGTTGGPRPVAGGFGLLLSLLRPLRRPLAIALVWALVEAAPTLLSGLLVAAAVDGGFLAGRPGTGLAWLGVLGAAMLLKAAATRLMFPYLAAVVEPLRDGLVRAVVTATVTRAVRGTEPPDTAAVTRLSEQVEMLRNLVSGLLRGTRALGISLVAALAGVLALSPPVAAVVAVPVAVALVMFARLMRVLMDRQRALILADETLTAAATPILAGLRDVKACGAEEQAYATVRAAVDRQAAATRALARTGLWRRLCVAVGAYLPLLGLLVAARPLVEGGRLSAGEVVGAATYLVTGLEPALRSLVGTMGSWGVALVVGLNRIAESIAVPEGAAPASPSHAASPAGHELRAERLTFAYAPGATPVVRDLDLMIPEGEHLAVVGPSGIGKSTLSTLLTGLCEPTGGRVTFGGLPFAAVPEDVRRNLVALVPQEAYVFAGTVAENLAYLCPAGTSDARLRAAARAVGADELVERLGGLHAVIEEPAALSAGERQLIALARTHASPARVVVLDEATCHLDPAAESTAETAFARRGGTLIVIAHRISSAARARRVLVLDGETALLGTHRDLPARSPLYADLVGHWWTPPAAERP
ncbi:ATP-binding cassette domain-containing protein [Sphaerisporangium fuscum]|uniref:ATP-binding cassette domain-containing protein n=1 Tax=Sphaerisporangium fuscum TaxID=2835868 RepID=UPI001BDDA1BB|nr:ABC transporter ATP-binding protein [Sphaerisporangium fuscum]